MNDDWRRRRLESGGMQYSYNVCCTQCSIAEAKRHIPVLEWLLCVLLILRLGSELLYSWTTEKEVVSSLVQLMTPYVLQAKALLAMRLAG
eukprot:365665-Chlamydomonas_euryale.AAC.13